MKNKAAKSAAGLAAGIPCSLSPDPAGLPYRTAAETERCFTGTKGAGEKDMWH